MQKLHAYHEHFVGSWEARILDRHLPAPAGILIILFGIVAVMGGAAMLVLPGQGILTIALGIAAVRIGIRVVRAERASDPAQSETVSSQDAELRRSDAASDKPLAQSTK